MKPIWTFLKKYKLECFLAPLFKLLEACFDLLVPIVVKSIMDVGIKNRDTSYIVYGCLILVALGIIGLTCAIVAQYFAARAAVGTSTGLRRALFAHLQTLSYTESDKLGRSSMITRMTSDINQVQSGVNLTLRLFLRSPIIVFGSLIMACVITPVSGPTFAIIIGILAIIVFTIILTGIPLYKRVQSRLDRVTGKTRETLTGARVIRAFNKQDDEIVEFSEANNAHTDIQNFTGKISALMNPLTYVTVNIGIIMIVYFSSAEINVGGMSQGDLFALYNYMSQILVELVKLANTIFTITKALACGNRIQAVLDIPSGMPISNETAGEVDSALAVEFKNVSMTYHGAGAPSLENLDLSVKSGSTVGIIGGTGSGKTTLVNMIPRFYDATEGEVRVFGRNVCEYELDTLREQVAIVPQKAVLFKGTIRSNLLWGKGDATDEELWAALAVAQADGFVKEKEGGLDAPVEQFGRNFSGGQRQRLTIARAIVRRAPIIILDDSASALDFATEARLRHALKSLDYDPTVFIISQRTSSIAHADSIVVLDSGEAVGIGTHEGLLESCPVYREIYDSQFKGGEAR
ncbi:MAG: ABC transporter ATP-binding protein [Ruminococcaceae bacterium]|nr:ABC transporter ATP-binding protein [Oscillospiraceae bacterium]